MKRNYFYQRFKTGLAFLFLIIFTVSISAQTTVSGKITDAETGEGLIGANILISGTNEGTITDLDGSFNLKSSQALPWSIEVSYTGYLTQNVNVTDDKNLDIKMPIDGVGLEQVVISASRKREKVQEAPAAISVITAAKLQVSAATTDVARSLMSVPGVQIQQQSASRMNIEMRGQSGLFGTGVFPILDYRSLIGPGIGTFNSSGAGLSSIDMQRVEVVRGPGSALYGPGVVSGVVHFITKNPIDYPGTTIEVFGGELNTVGASVRHAGRNEAKTFGYKINAQYKRGDEFTLDSVEDSLQIQRFQTTISQPAITNGVVDVNGESEVLLTEKDLDPDGDGNMMSDEWWNTAINATLEFRPQDDLNVTVSGGFNQFSEVFYNSQGEGLTQNKEFWGQARVQKGGLFGQVFYVDNNGGSKDKPTFLYQTGLRTPIARKQLEGQLQYNFDVPTLLNADVTAGIDFRQAISETENLVYGRNEDDDDYQIVGAYVQSKFKLTNKLDFLLAGRYDRFNFLDDGFFSPRAAFVYKHSPTHTFRATYNRAGTPPSALQVNIDFPVVQPVPGLFDVWLIGNKDPNTFTNGLIDVTIPGVPSLPVGTPGLPLAVPYGAVSGAVLAQLLPGLQDTPLEPLIPLISAYFMDPTNAPQGFTGELQPYNLFTGQPYEGLPTSETARLSETTAFEIGYKGLFGDKFSASIDVYTNKTKGFIFFGAVGPTYRLANPNVGADLGAAVSSGLEAFLLEQGIDPAAAAAAAGAAGGAYTAGGQGFDAQVSALYGIFGAVESDLAPVEEAGNDIVHSAAGYQSFSDDSYSYWGTDIGLQYYFSNDISGFFNYSYLSQNEWKPGEVDNSVGNFLKGENNLPFAYNLNQPKNKFRMGVNYTPELGLRGSVSFQHDQSFNAAFGQFAGDTDEKNLVDMSVGYKLSNGLSVDLSCQNLFDNEYRAFPNFPKIGRRALAKLTYTFGTE
ncbi:MAG: outer membrane receptor for ferrienterochelin and colicins [Saprospiraceae bacterium]|jgi:outer membrane receptor for ferrienterochelin and colicins